MSTLAFNVSNFASELHRLNLPVPDQHTISDIADIEGDALSRAIAEFKKNNDRAVFYLKGILSIVTPSTRERLQRRGMMCPPLKVLLLIAKKTGTEFAERLERWDSEGSVNSEDARYVRLTVANALAHVSKTAEAKGIEADASASKVPGDARNVIPLVQDPSSHDGVKTASQVPAQAERENHLIETAAQNQHEDPEQPIKEGERDFASYHVYGGNFASCFSADMTRGHKHTVRIEASEMKGGKANWSGKIAVQLSQRELPMVLATLLLWMPEFDGKGHGENNQKWFSIKQQAGKFYLKVDSKGQTSRGVPILPGDVYGIITLFIRQMLKNDPFLNVDVLLSIVRKQAELAAKFPPPSS